MGITVRSHLALTELRKLVPKRFQKHFQALALPAGSFSLVLFSGAKDEVVMSGGVRKALTDLEGTGDTIVAVAFGFTAEALATLRETRAVACTISDHHWSDESFAAIRQATRLPRLEP
jgi:hypothetical protein